MIAKTYIEKNLQDLNKLYSEVMNQSSSTKKCNYYSKLALLELCGWIEISFDDIILSYAKKKLKERKNIKQIEDSVKRVSSFEYKDKIRPLLITLVGIVKIEKLEKKLAPQISTLESQLSNLKTERNKQAHTYLKGVTTTVSSPTVVLGYFQTIYPILIKLKEELLKI